MKRRSLGKTSILWVTLGASPLFAMRMSLDEYTHLAIRKGIDGEQNTLSLESAGYTRRIAFRETDAPVFSVGGTLSRSERSGPSTSASTHGVRRTDAGDATVTMNQVLPTGTQITGSAQTVETEYKGVGSSASAPERNFSVSATQPIYIFVKNSVARTRKQATLYYENAQNTFESTSLSIRSQARSIYYGVLQGDETIKVEERKVASSRRLLDITQALVQGGKTPSVETMRAKIRLLTDERQLQNAIVTRAKAMLTAKDFISMPPDSDIEFTSTLQFKPLMLSLERITQYAMLHNPQLKTLRRNRELADLTLQAAREATRPTLSLTSSYDGSSVPNGMNRTWEVLGEANWRFFDSYITRDTVAIDRIAKTVADLNLADGERTVRLNLNNAFLDIKNAERQIMDFNQSREQARRNVEVLQLRFRSGLERLIDVFDAENEMRNQDNEYLSLLVNFNRLKDQISQSLGADVETVK